MQIDMRELETRWENMDSPIGKDLKLNFNKFASEASLSPEEVGFIVLAVAQALGSEFYVDWAKSVLQTLEQSPERIREAQESAAIMGMVNTYYKFKFFMSKMDPSLVERYYARAGLRMTSIGRPILGKELFELLALAVSLVNGCETCVTSHEKSLRDLGVDSEKLHDTVRLTAVLKGLTALA